MGWLLVVAWGVVGGDSIAGGRRLSEDEASVKALMFQMLVDSLLLREAQEPDLDRGQLENAVRHLVASILQ